MAMTTMTLWRWCLVFVCGVVALMLFSNSFTSSPAPFRVVDLTKKDYVKSGVDHNTLTWWKAGVPDVIVEAIAEDDEDIVEEIAEDDQDNAKYNAEDNAEDNADESPQEDYDEEDYKINSMSFNAKSQMKVINEKKEDANGRKKRLPDYILIGERKTGTTALLIFLLNHPQVKAPRREVHFFDLRRNFRKGLLWYADHMQPTTRNEVTFEKSPSYFRNKWAAVRMRATLPDVKILLSVRDPIKRAISDFHFSKNAEWECGFDRTKFETFEEYVLDTKNGSVDQEFRPLQHSFYSYNMRVWLKYFDKNQIHIIDGDRIVNENPAKELRKMEAFMKLEPYFTDDMFFFRDNRGYWCLRHPGCIEFGGQPHPKVKDEVIHKLRSLFSPYNEDFYKLINQTFTW